MEEASFREQMIRIDTLTQEARAQEALSLATELREELLAEGIADGHHAAWSVYYELRLLHQLQRWESFNALLSQHAALLPMVGGMNLGYAMSLAMEATTRAGEPEALPSLAGRCFEARLGDRDMEALKMAVGTARALLDQAERQDLLVEVYVVLAEAASRHGAARIQELAEGWIAQCHAAEESS